MKILFLHIGDMHIKNKEGINEFQIRKIADALNSFSGFDKVIIIIAGDIAQSGTPEQYKYARWLVGKLITSIKTKCKTSVSIEVVCVPGNHDLNHNGTPMTSTELQDIKKSNSYDENLPAELKKQQEFFNFANYNHCFMSMAVFDQRIIQCSGFSIEVNLINTGVFSILDEDKGLHYIPRHCINHILTPTEADFVITVMHHAPDWYTDEIKTSLEESIFGKSSVLFLGHEHYIANKTVGYEANSPTIIQAGGCLCKNEDWSNSSFHVSILDTDNFSYCDVEYKWNSKQSQYEVQETLNRTLQHKPSIERILRVSDDYLLALLSDEKRHLTSDFRDYYVFPRIQSEDRNNDSKCEFLDEEAFIQEILCKKKVLITGGYDFGKTSLLKKLFLHFIEKQFAVIYFDASGIKGKSASRIIKSCFEDIYGDSDSDYARYEQMPRDKKVLIIDDIDQIKDSSFSSFIAKIDNEFEYFIFSSKQVIDISLLERMKNQLKAVDSISRYRIMPMYSDKRRELIESIVRIKAEDSDSVPRITTLLSDAITSQRRFISLDPNFIIKYVECYCNNIGDISGRDSGIFSKVFEASLTNAISVNQSARLSVDKVFVLLSKVAYYIHFNKAYPITEQQLIAVVDKYNEDYGDNVRAMEFVEISTKSKILIYDEVSLGYRFLNRNYLAYYVAREVNSQYHYTGNDTDLRNLLKCACFGINADILLFISHITSNINVLRLILQIATEYTNDWAEFDFTDNLPAFLRSERTHNVPLPSPDAKQIETHAEVMSEKEFDSQVKTLDIYDYVEDDVDKFVNQVMRAVQLLTIVARCLPNFEHMMLKPDKDNFVKAIYTIPNKLFYLWAAEADKEVPEILQFFREQSQDYYERQKNLDEDDLIRALQWAAMSFLLDLYNLPILQATKDNTIRYLSDFDYSRKETYELEHLMMLERRSSPHDFIDKAVRMKKNSRGHIYPVLISRIVGHALIYRTDFDHNHIEQIHSKFFPQKELQKKYMIKRLQTGKKENE